jgi:hypothetical protein
MSSNHISRVVDVRGEGITGSIRILELGYCFIATPDWNLQRWPSFGVILSRQPEIGEVISGRTKSSWKPSHAASEVGLPIRKYEMVAIGIHPRGIHHNIVAVAIPCERVSNYFAAGIRHKPMGYVVLVHKLEPLEV